MGSTVPSDAKCQHTGLGVPTLQKQCAEAMGDCAGPLCAALPSTPREMHTHRAGWWYSSLAAGFLHTEHAEYVYGQQKDSNHVHKKSSRSNLSVSYTPHLC